MSEDSNKLLENLMGMLGDNPSEKLGQMLSALTENSEKEKEEEKERSVEEEKEESSLNFDPSMFFKIQNLMGQFNHEDKDERSELLKAIKPFLSDDKKSQIDQAIKFLKLAKIAKTAQELDLFKELL